MRFADKRTEILGALAMFLPATFVIAESPVRVDSYALLQLQEAAATPPEGTAQAAPTLQVNDKPTDGPSVDATKPVTDSASQQKHFGAQNSLQFMVEGGWISDWGDSDMAQGRIGLGWFFVENFELDMFFTLDYVSQHRENAFGGGFDMQLRWHILALENWSFFVEVGGGVLGTNHSVPAHGSPFNFTPNAGVGMTFALDPATRLYFGVNWFHISNAGTYSSNPGRENTQVWLGLAFQM